MFLIKTNGLNGCNPTVTFENVLNIVNKQLTVQKRFWIDSEIGAYSTISKRFEHCKQTADSTKTFLNWWWGWHTGAYSTISKRFEHYKQTADSTKTFLNWWWNRCILHHFKTSDNLNIITVFMCIYMYLCVFICIYMYSHVFTCIYMIIYY